MQRHPIMSGGPTPGGPQDLRKDRHEPMTDPRAGLPYSRPHSGDPRDMHDMREGRDPRGLPGREYEVQVSHRTTCRSRWSMRHRRVTVNITCNIQLLLSLGYEVQVSYCKDHMQRHTRHSH